MKTLLKTVTTVIVLTTIAAGSASACETLDGNAQALKHPADQRQELTITQLECDEVDAVAQELRSRLNISGSVLSKLIRSASKPYKSASSS